MNIKKEVTARLTKDDVKEAIKDWLIVKGYRATHIEFDLVPSVTQDYILEGATCTVEENGK